MNVWSHVKFGINQRYVKLSNLLQIQVDKVDHSLIISVSSLYFIHLLIYRLSIINACLLDIFT